MNSENVPELDQNRKIGEGVFEVDLELNGKNLRTYAAKCFLDETSRNREFKTLESIAKLSHDSIVTAYAKKELGSGLIEYYCIVLELEGESMEKQLTTESPPPGYQDDLLKHIHKLIEALCCLHKLGFHYDIKPANILLKRSGSGKGYIFVDFGVFVKSGSPVRGDSGYSEYAPPPSPSGMAEGKSDVWSLACVVLELLIWAYLGGKSALDKFRAEKKAELEEHLRECYTSDTEHFYVQKSGRVQLNAAVDEWLGKLGNCSETASVVPILQKMLNVDPAERSTVKEALDQFTQCIQN